MHTVQSPNPQQVNRALSRFWPASHIHHQGYHKVNTPIVAKIMLIKSLFLSVVLSATFDVIRCGDDKAALIIIDIQDCFISGGSLAVNGGNDIIPVINRIREKFHDDLSLVVLSQDWHPTGHVSFASNHPGVQSPMSLEYSPQGQLCLSPNITIAKFPDATSCKDVSGIKHLQQVLWPDHCVQNINSGPTSAAFASGLKVEGDDLIIQKGTDREIDSYSAFFDNGGFGKTKLDSDLRARGITHVFVTGLAADYCVYFTSLDAQALGFETYYVMDATKPVADDSYQKATRNLAMKGVHLTTSDKLPDIFKEMRENNSGHRIVGGFSFFLMFTLTLLVKAIH